MSNTALFRNGVIHGASLLKIVLFAFVLTPNLYLEYVSHIAYAQLFAAVAGLGYIECMSRDYVREKVFYFNYFIVPTSIIVLMTTVFIFTYFETGYNFILLGAYTFAILCYQSLQRLARAFLGLDAFYEHLVLKISFDLVLIFWLLINGFDDIFQILFLEAIFLTAVSVLVWWRISTFSVAIVRQELTILIGRSKFFYMTAVLSNISGNIFRFTVGLAEFQPSKDVTAKLPFLDISIQLVRNLYAFLFTQWFGGSPKVIRGLLINATIFVLSAVIFGVLYGEIVTVFVIASILSGLFVSHLTYLIEYYRMEYAQTISILSSLIAMFIYVSIAKTGDPLMVTFVTTVSAYVCYLIFYVSHWGKR